MNVVEALVKMLREPIGSSTSTKACLATIFNLVSSAAANREGIVQRFVPLLSYITWNGTRLVVSTASSSYC